MGGIFGSPSPPPPPRLPKTADPEEELRRQRLLNLQRRRRGRLGTVETSSRGILARRDTPRGNSLLGE